MAARPSPAIGRRARRRTASSRPPRCRRRTAVPPFPRPVPRLRKPLTTKPAADRRRADLDGVRAAPRAALSVSGLQIRLSIGRAGAEQGDDAMSYRVAVVGATGNVGREMLQILAEHDFPAKEVVAVASSRSAGAEVSFGEDKVLKVHDLADFNFKG